MSRSTRARSLVSLFAALLVAGLVPAVANATLSGTYTIGPSGAYPTLTAAFSDLNLQGAAGRVTFELAPGYSGAAETYPLSPPPNAITIRPQAGASALVLSSASTSVLSIGFGAQLVVDGRPGGVGTSSELTLRSTSASAATVKYIDAAADTLRWLTIQGAVTATTSGVVTLAVGFFECVDQVIEHCRITNSTGIPANLIYAAAGISSRTIRRVTVQDCELSNWFSDAGGTAAISTQVDNYDWTIRRNSFFQTATRTFVTSGRIQYAILVNGAVPNLVIEDNWIGGSAAQCGGTPWTLTGVGGMTLLYANADLVQGASVKRNTIRNISAAITSSWRAISLFGPAQVEDNVIGDGTASGHIAVQATTSQCVALALNTSGGGTVVGNRVSNLTLTATTGLFHAIQVTSNGTGPNGVTVRRNLVGGATLAEGVSASGSGLCTGITLGGQTSVVNTADSNTVAGLTHGAASTASTCAGLRVIAGPWSLSRNTVSRLASSALSTAPAGTPTLAGIHYVTTLPIAFSASHNIVHSLTSTAASSSPLVAGIVLDVPVDGTAALEGNFVHSLGCASADSAARVTGIQIGSAAAAGAATASNNMAAVGLGPAGENAVQGARCTGLDSRGPVTWIGNSVSLVAILGATGNTSSSAMEIAAAPEGPVLRNNILENLRGARFVGGSHCALRVAALPLAGFSSDHNVLNAPGHQSLPPSRLVVAAGVPLFSLGAWQAFGFDAASAAGDAMFVAPLGDAAGVDLHVAAGSDLIPVASNSGVVWLGWLSDFDGDPRDATHPDIGADEFEVSNTGVDDGPSRALALSPARPNPARGACTFEFALERECAARLDVFDAGGRHVRALARGTLGAGVHRVVWDRRDDGGRALPPGSYLVRLSSAGGRGVRRVVVLD